MLEEYENINIFFAENTPEYIDTKYLINKYFDIIQHIKKVNQLDRSNFKLDIYPTFIYLNYINDNGRLLYAQEQPKNNVQVIRNIDWLYNFRKSLIDDWEIYDQFKSIITPLN